MALDCDQEIFEQHAEVVRQKLREVEWRPYAERVAATNLRGYLTADEILAVWHRHPLWAPGAKYGPPLPSSPIDSMLMRFRRFRGV